MLHTSINGCCYLSSFFLQWQMMEHFICVSCILLFKFSYIVDPRLSESQLSDTLIIETPKGTVLLEYFSIVVCSIRVNDCSIEYLDKVLCINQWASVIQTNSFIWTLFSGAWNRGVRITKDALYIVRVNNWRLSKSKHKDEAVKYMYLIPIQRHCYQLSTEWISIL